MPSRRELRQLYKVRRGGLTPAQRADASKRIADHLLAYPSLSNQAQISGQHPATVVAAFAATATEVDLTPWIQNYLSQGGHVALPRVGQDRSMEFYTFDAGTELEDNVYGIAEPVADSPKVNPEEIDAVLTPLVAFDDAGHRLGMGGGYYDRYLPRLRAGVPLIGVAFTCQHHREPLPREVWDVPLHAVVTEDGVIEFAGSSA